MSADEVARDALYGVVGMLASSPDLDGVLSGVVDVLTRTTDCHACFVYLRHGERLRMRAASPLYAHLVGKLEFGLGEGLAGWAVRNNRAAFIRENALADPRTVYVPELDEERFQSMVAVPIPSRTEPTLGVIVLHTIAPREFDERTLGLLEHTAPILAGAIENAQLYEQARLRVAALTALAELGQRIAEVEDRAGLYGAASEGVRTLLQCDAARLYEVDASRDRLELVAIDPPDRDQVPPVAVPISAAGVLRDVARYRAVPDDVSLQRLRDVLAISTEHLVAVPVGTSDRSLGLLVAGSSAPLEEGTEELLRAAANQLAIAFEKAALIERLTEENIVRDLLDALEHGRLVEAETLAQRARCDLGRPHVLVEAARARDAEVDASWPVLAERVEAGLRRLAPGAMCEAGPERLRALLPLASRDAGALERLDAALEQLAARERTAIGRSDVKQSTAEASAGGREASDAAYVAAALAARGGARAYSQLGAYRYLIHLAGDPPRDAYGQAIATLADYDRHARAVPHQPPQRERDRADADRSPQHAASAPRADRDAHRHPGRERRPALARARDQARQAAPALQGRSGSCAPSSSGARLARRVAARRPATPHDQEDPE
jgi:GAF domain-containing protein